MFGLLERWKRPSLKASTESLELNLDQISGDSLESPFFCYPEYYFEL